MMIAVPASAQTLQPPPYDVINRHGVNIMSGTVAPKFVDVSIGGALGLSHYVTTAANDFVNVEAGYGPKGPRDKYFGRLVKTVRYKQTSNDSTWIWVMRAVSFDGGHDFTINPGCTMDEAGNVGQYNTFSSFDTDPRHLLEYTADKKGLVWTRPDGTRVVYDIPLAINAGACFTNTFGSESTGYRFKRVEYPNGFTVTAANGDRLGEVTTNTGFQLTYIYVARPDVDPYYGATKDEAWWAPTAADAGWGSGVPTYIVALNNAYDYCAPQGTGPYQSVADACPGLTKAWPFVTYNWPVGMPRVAYLKDRETTFTITDARGGVTKYIHKAFRTTASEVPTEIWHPRLHKVQPAGSDVPAIVYDYETKNVPVEAGTDMSGRYVYWISGPAAQLKTSIRNTASGEQGTDKMDYDVGAQNDRWGSETKNAGGGREGSISISLSNKFGPYLISMWDKNIRMYSTDPTSPITAPQYQLYSRVTEVDRKTDGVKVEYEYDARFNITAVKEAGVVVSRAYYPPSCDTSSLKTCNQPTWTRDARGNQTDYEYHAQSGQVTRVIKPADEQGIRPETRFEYSPKYAFYKRSAGGTVQQADTPIYLLTKETSCVTGSMLSTGACAKGAGDTVTTTYDYGPTNAANNLLLRGVAVSAYADGASQVRRTCYSYDAYGNRIGETRPKAALASCN